MCDELNAVNYQPAGFWPRVAAKLADVCLVIPAQPVLLCAASVIHSLTGISAWLLLPPCSLVLALILYLALGNSCGRRTLGYRFAGIRVLTADGSSPGSWRGLWRAILGVTFLLLVMVGVGVLAYIPMIFDRSRRSAHDRLFGTRVVKEGKPKYAALALLMIGGIALNFAIVLAVMRPFFAQAFYVPSGSMDPTLIKGQSLIANKLYYRFHTVESGDLVIFRTPPRASEDGRSRDYVKRVVGVPGDTLEVRSDGRLYRDGKLVREPYIKEPVWSYTMGPLTIPRGKVFVLGDNRNVSNDSHTFGPIPLGNVKAKVMFVYPRFLVRS